MSPQNSHNKGPYNPASDSNLFAKKHWNVNSPSSKQLKTKRVKLPLTNTSCSKKEVSKMLLHKEQSYLWSYHASCPIWLNLIAKFDYPLMTGSFIKFWMIPNGSTFRAGLVRGRRDYMTRMTHTLNVTNTVPARGLLTSLLNNSPLWPIVRPARWSKRIILHNLNTGRVMSAQ